LVEVRDDGPVEVPAPPRGRESFGKLSRFVALLIVRAVKFFRLDVATLAFMASAVFAGFALRLQIVESAAHPKAFLCDLAFVSLFAAAGFLIRRRRRPIYYITVTVVFATLVGLDTVYFRSHGSILSAFLAPQIEFLPQVAAAVMLLFNASDLIYLASAVALIAAMVVLCRHGYFQRDVETGRARVRKAITCVLVAVVILGTLGAFLNRTEASRITKHWNRPYLVEHFGVYTYHISDFIKFALSSPTNAEIDPNDFARVSRFFEVGGGAPAHVPNAYTGILQGKNIILIHAESVEGSFLFRNMHGQEITPNINRLAREGLYFDTFYSQQSAGTSSDSEFTLNTSLYPINKGTVFISHFDRTFVSLPEELRQMGYSTLALHGNDGDFWNRAIMNETLGYDRYLSKSDFEIDEVIGMGLSDVSFFRQGAEILAQTQLPLYATFIMLTNHTPFDDVDKYGEFPSGEFEGTRFGNYLKSLHYADGAIGAFVDDLEKRGLLDNTAIVIYGDHPANLDRGDMKRFLGLASLDSYDMRRVERVPFIIWSPEIDEPRVISTPMGMVDVMPTLGNMLGVENPYAFGHDLLSVTENRVAFPDGSWLDENIIYDAAKMKYKVFGRALLEEYVDASRAEVHPILRDSAATDVDLAPATTGAINEIPQERVFEYQPDSVPENGLARYVFQRVHRTTTEVAEHLEVSDMILEYDLLRLRDDEHRYSIASLE
jgi:phosphoglycerol transferase MdoB-like AlkP superfamily enzyme